MDIYYSSHFLKSMKRLPASLKKELDEREEMFRNNPFDSRLRTHKLTGTLKGHWSFSITYQRRVLFRFLNGGSVRFDDVGDHRVYR